MTLLFLAFLSGVLTILAPCILPMLPVILSGTLGDTKNKYTPAIIIASLAVSLFLFSLLLKVTTLFISIPNSFWIYFSGTILILLGVTFIVPKLWSDFSIQIGIERSSKDLLEGASQKNGFGRSILIGFSLGPIFSSCSPTYLIILSLILPSNFGLGIVYLVAYIIGLTSMLFFISLLGHRLIQKVKWASNPNGVFKKILGTILIIVGISIISGFDKWVEGKILDTGICSMSSFEEQFTNGFKKK